MKQETKKPLYKVLNETRTQIAFSVKSADKNDMKIVGYPILPNPENFKEQMEQEEKLYASYRYTNLAVDNLHLLAEILDGFLKDMQDPVKSVSEIVHNLKIEAKEALNRIS